MQKFNEKGVGAIAGILVILLSYFQTCNSGGVQIAPVTCITKIDTLRIVDTLFFTKTDTLWNTKWHTLTDTIFIDREVLVQNDEVPGLSIVRTTGNQADSLINIKYSALTKGTLLGLTLDYKLLKPTTIHTKDTLNITEYLGVTKTSYLSGIHIGALASLEQSTNRFSAKASLMLTTPNRWGFQYTYDLIHKEHSVGAHYRLINIGRQ